MFPITTTRSWNLFLRVDYSSISLFSKVINIGLLNGDTLVSLQPKKSSKREIGNMKRKLTNSKKKTQKMQEAYDNDEVESAEEFLRKFAKSK